MRGAPFGCDEQCPSDGPDESAKNEGAVMQHSIASLPAHGPPCATSPSGPRWHFNFGAGTTPWVGPAPPDLARIRQARGIRNRRNQSHVPVWAFSITVGQHLRLESGLEHDLVRDLDQRPSIVWLVPQPARVLFQGAMSGRHDFHYPDLLSIDVAGVVTVWDVRPVERQDEKFQSHAELTREACATFGWRYELFSGMSATRRVNLMWLDGYRRTMPWHRTALKMLGENLGTLWTIGQAIDLDEGEGHLLSAVWHGIRSGDLTVDLDERLGRETRVCLTTSAAAR